MAGRLSRDQEEHVLAFEFRIDFLSVDVYNVHNYLTKLLKYRVEIKKIVKKSLDGKENEINSLK